MAARLKRELRIKFCLLVGGDASANAHPGAHPGAHPCPLPQTERQEERTSGMLLDRYPESIVLKTGRLVPMIISCPSCATRYLVDPKALGGGGRTVRCASCEHTWFQTPPEDMPRDVVLTPAPEAVRPLPPGSNLPTFAKPPSRGYGAAIGWAVFLFCFLGSIGGVFAMKEQIVERWPPAARLYEVLGAPVETAGAGLEVRNVVSSRRDEAGASVIVVEGIVVNVSGKARDVPPLRVFVRSSAKQDLKDWTLHTDVKTLQPGEIVNFRSELRDPPRGATDLAIEFSAS